MIDDFMVEAPATGIGTFCSTNKARATDVGNRESVVSVNKGILCLLTFEQLVDYENLVSGMNRVALFVIACLLGGIGGAVGSIVGHAAGSVGLWVGGIVGGLVASVATARIALWRHWIGRSQLWPTAFGTAVGFLIAAAIAVKTLSSPIGPIASTLLIGVGAIIGSIARGSSAREAGE